MLKSLSLSTIVVALAVLATPASAAPASGLKGIDAGSSGSLAEHVGYRRCWWSHGYRHCRWVGDGYYNYGPSFSLRFGHRHHRHHGYYRHYRY